MPVERGTVCLPITGPVAVTGGAQGIGLALARRAIESGAQVGLLDTDTRQLAKATEELGTEQARAISCDVSDATSVEDAFAEFTKELGPPRGVVANAGIERLGRIDQMDEREWDEVISVNLGGQYRTCRAALRAMHSLGGGSIVCVSSPISRGAIPGSAAYGASKAGVGGLVRALALDHASEGIRVNAVIPGATNTRLMWSNVEEDRQAEIRAELAEQIPAGRLAEPAEPAEAILWLLSEGSSYVTGSELVCDGGLLARAAISV